jgi:methylated-DNA-protein-cysteine methyltransferase-like protein
VKVDLPPKLRTRPRAGDDLEAEQTVDTAQSGSTLARLRAIIARIPAGRVATYGQIAERGGLIGGARMTVWALRSAPNLPWHRVVGAGGRITLPGAGGQEQRRRLRKEGITFDRGRVPMERHQWGRVPRARTGRSMPRPPTRNPRRDRGPEVNRRR